MLVVSPLWGKQQEKAYSYPLASVNMAGEGYKILAGGQILSVEITFKDELDKQAFENLRQEILFNSVNHIGGAPKLYLVGRLKDEKKFIADSWYLTTPFYEVNSIAEGLYDPQKTKERNKLAASDFNKKWLINEIVDGKFVASTERPKVDWSKYQKVITTIKVEAK